MYICFNVTQDQKRGHKPGGGATSCGAAKGAGEGCRRTAEDSLPGGYFSPAPIIQGGFGEQWEINLYVNSYANNLLERPPETGGFFFYA
jgi:hypothetical protein